jgi:putative transposase
MRIREIAQTRVSYGFRRIHVMLQREGWKVNHKRVYRLYKLEGLVMRSRGLRDM